MRRRRGFMGSIISFIGVLIICGLGFAIIRQFDGDVVGAFQWGFQWVLNLIISIADKFTEMPGFRNLFNK